MLAFLEIKKDIANGYTYMEYEGSWYGMEYCIILDVHSNDLIFSFTNDKFENATFAMEIHHFLSIMWYKDYIKEVLEFLYYAPFVQY